MRLEAIYQPKGRAREYANYALNLSTGCTHGCKYCYVPAMLRKTREEFHAAAPLRGNIFAKLERDLTKMQAAGIRDHVVMSFTTDPYCTPEMAAATRRALQMFRAYDVPFTVLTKGGMLAIKDFDLYRECDAFGTTLTFDDQDDSEAIEPNAALPGKRYGAIQEASDRGIFTWVSFEPVLDVDQVEYLFRKTVPYVDLYKIGKTNHGYPHRVKDWGAFGRRMVELCEEYGKLCYIKRDLAEEMNPLSPMEGATPW
jgi:DNA repair photolyase